MHESKEKIADQVKQGRIAKGYTQLQLAQLTNISLRSIQRIENGEVNARMYTLKILADHLGFEIENVVVNHGAPVANRMDASNNKIRKIILSSGVGVLLILLGGAFLSQAPSFPETTFELFIFWASFVVLYLLILWWIWRQIPATASGNK